MGIWGFIMMEDYVMWEKIFYFDYERIFEWVVYVRGYGVYGYFEMYELLFDIICVDIF